MQIYKVGGAVRDRLLGRPVSDIDWVVVGARAEELAALGYRPVGDDFPVFLHPQSGEEYALARTERKTALGYHGFAFHAAPSVTLEEDLARRDLTINAMARDESGRLSRPESSDGEIARMEDTKLLGWSVRGGSNDADNSRWSRRGSRPQPSG